MPHTFDTDYSITLPLSALDGMGCHWNTIKVYIHSTDYDDADNPTEIELWMHTPFGMNESLLTLPVVDGDVTLTTTHYRTVQAMLIQWVAEWQELDALAELVIVSEVSDFYQACLAF